MDQATADKLTLTGPGTPMGNLMRRYWVPIMLSREIAEPDCPPVRIQILGEKLLAFRDSEGKAALISEFCSHRAASLYFGRNEENGIRCAYHGLKFDRDGNCVDVPSAPQACKSMGITAYPCIERVGMVWAYMGPKDKMPDAPAMEWINLPDENVFVSKRLQECNYLQALEGGIDTAHVSYVHKYEVDNDPLHQGTLANKYIKADGNVIFEVEDQDWGLMLCGRRNGEPDSYYWRITQWVMPWFTLIPPFGDHAMGGHVWVPIDDHNCWAWSFNFHVNKALSAEERAALEAGKGIHCEYEEGTFRPKANKDNDYLIDRVAQKEKRAYSGIFGIAVQDTSLQESMGPIQDRTQEKLLPTDRAIVATRRKLLNAIDLMERGEELPANDANSQKVRSAGVLLPREQNPKDWAKEHLMGNDPKTYSI